MVWYATRGNSLTGCGSGLDIRAARGTQCVSAVQRPHPAKCNAMTWRLMTNERNDGLHCARTISIATLRYIVSPHLQR